MSDIFSPPPLLAVSMGDAAGIGPEIILKAAAAEPGRWAHVCVVGDWQAMQRAHAVCVAHPEAVSGRLPELQRVASWSEARCLARPGHLSVLQAGTAWNDGELPRFGEVSASAGAMAAASVELAAQAVLDGQAAALVTAPLNKNALAAAGVGFPGHTEMLQALAARHLGTTADRLPVRMMLANEEIRSVLNSIHVSLRDAIAAVTPDQVFDTIAITHRFLQRAVPPCRDGERLPRIAVAGLNPHAGEGGLFGDEETSSILPAIERARAAGMDVQGPFPPDTVFMLARQAHQAQPPFCDAVVAMYHDQGLIPVKYLGVEEGVNITLGLPLVRTSPDHGTAFDLAGTAQASCASMQAAMQAAARMS